MFINIIMAPFHRNGTDGVIYRHTLFQGATDAINGSNGFPLSSNATNVAFLGDDIVFVRVISGVVSVISGSVIPGDSDGSAPKLCQPLGTCVEFDRNMYFTDVESGSIKIVNRPTKGMGEFFQNLQMLVRAFDIHSRKSPLTEPCHTIDQGIEIAKNVLQYVEASSQKAKRVQSLKKSSATDGPQGNVSNKCLKSLELLNKSLSSIKTNIEELSTFPGFNITLNMAALLTLHVENQHAETNFKRDTFTL